MNDHLWDKQLRISTGGRMDSHSDSYHYPYEPTPYSVLKRLAESEYLSAGSHVIDYGCGKGRVSFFLHHFLGCRVTGIEFDEKLYKQALENQAAYKNSSAKSQGPHFIHKHAEHYQPEAEDCFYFFNPFSIEILNSVMGQIMNSYYQSPRPMRFFFYYPNDDYLSYLMTMPQLLFLDEIDCQDLFEGNNRRERILIFEI